MQFRAWWNGPFLKAKKMSKIITTYETKPIPVRHYDWEAVREDDDEYKAVGYGATEKEAINDLLELEEELK